MNARTAAGFALLVALMAPSIASAYPMFDVTASEVLSVDPPRVKTTFTVVESGYVPEGWCQWSWFDMTPLHPDAPDAPQFFACEAPTNGRCDLISPGGVQRFFFDPYEGDAGTLPANTFTIITDRAEPCVRIVFYCIVLMGAVPPLETCLLVDMPVPATPTSWGAVKSIYR